MLSFDIPRASIAPNNCAVQTVIASLVKERLVFGIFDQILHRAVLFCAFDISSNGSFSYSEATALRHGFRAFSLLMPTTCPCDYQLMQTNSTSRLVHNRNGNNAHCSRLQQYSDEIFRHGLTNTLKIHPLRSLHAINSNLEIGLQYSRAISSGGPVAHPVRSSHASPYIDCTGCAH
jgi:hypothetical protein